MSENAPRSGWHAVPRGVWTLGIVSMLMDVSSEMIHALLPVYMLNVLGLSGLTIGLIEGAGEATASLTRIASGVLSDRLGRRKLPAAIGYGLAACSKPIFPLAGSAGWLAMARCIDRVGKGIRGAPRDAMIADIAPPAVRGASFGLRQSLDTVGAFLGPALAIGLMWATADRFRTVFWCAVVPAFLSLGVMIVGVREVARPALPRVAPAGDGKGRLIWRELRGLERPYWRVVMIAALFTLAQFSDAFLVLRARSTGLGPALVPLVLVVMNVVYALAAYPAGILSDRVRRPTVLAVGLGLLIAADLWLALSRTLAGAALGVALWGLHLGFTEGVMTALVADTAPPERRGTAFGLFDMVTGLALLGASLMAGALWDRTGFRGTFIAGALVAALTLLGLLMTGPLMTGPLARDRRIS
ncbi:MFS transporter [Nguyenibacter vanlangensis]|uniref:MFS transporter n=2 Tax=Nguyenibacter vanlangensis TaxID=1216886 RepID=A0ABZ3D8W2_9PROT